MAAELCHDRDDNQEQTVEEGRNQPLSNRRPPVGPGERGRSRQMGWELGKHYDSLFAELVHLGPGKPVRRGKLGIGIIGLN